MHHFRISFARLWESNVDTDFYFSRVFVLHCFRNAAIFWLASTSERMPFWNEQNLDIHGSVRKLYNSLTYVLSFASFKICFTWRLKTRLGQNLMFCHKIGKRSRCCFECTVMICSVPQQGGLNKKEIKLNLCNIFSTFMFNELYLFA